MPNRSFLLLFYMILITFFFSNCKKDDDLPEEPNHPVDTLQPTTLTDAFESGNIGSFEKINDTTWQLFIGDDNGNSILPSSWRSWWYVRFDSILVNSITTISVKNSGWPFYYIPVYSYDQQTWHRYEEAEVRMYENNELVIRKQFEQKTVWTAMFYPYTASDLEAYLEVISGNPYIEITVPGTSQAGNPIYLLRITDPGVPQTFKKRVVMHARTHPAETPQSFLIEGLVNELLSGTPDAEVMLENYEFYIFPMQNVDGVIAGNYRSTPQSENLEMMWVFDPANPLELINPVPEVNVIHNLARDLMTDGGPPVTIALNLHASNSEKDVRPFFFPHFGPAGMGYSPPEVSLWNHQVHFINRLADHYGYDMLEPVPTEGGSSFASKTYPESWWWANFKDSVMAMTMELTYGRAGYEPEWVTPDNYRLLGADMLWAIRDYHHLPAQPLKNSFIETVESRKALMEYPELYPSDEGGSKK